MPGKPLPHNLDAEIAVLGAVLMSEKALTRIQQAGLTSAHFYREAHGRIYGAMERLHARREPIDLITVTDELGADGERCGGATYLAEISEQVSTSAGAAHHARMVMDCAIKRRVIETCRAVARSARASHTDPLDLMQMYRQTAIDLEAEAVRGVDDTDPVVAIAEVFEEVFRRAKTGDHTVGPLTGFDGIDRHLFGLEPGATYYIGAESTTGKTALALQIVDQVCKSAGGAGLFYTLESTALEVNMRRLSRESGIALTRIRRGNFRDAHDEERITQASMALSEQGVRIIDDTQFCDFGRLQAHTEAFTLEYPLTIVAVDFLQQAYMRGKFNTDHHMYKAIANGFNRLAKLLKVPILVLSQLNEDGKLKESRDIHNTAIHEWILERKDQEADEMKVRGVKAKNSGPWVTWLRFDRYIQKFYDMPRNTDN